MKAHGLMALLAVAVLMNGCIQQTSPKDEPVSQPAQMNSYPVMFGMKGVAITLPQKDFDDMKKADIEVLATEWGMEQDVARARAFLDQAHEAGLKVVMDGGFSARAWGFTDDDWDNLPAGKRPVWQKYLVQGWINALKDHPAIYSWDICNEFGENLPSGAGVENSDWPKSMITIEQIKQAKADVLEADPTRPIHVRVYGWDIGEMPPHVNALLENKIADIISLNLYSNYLNQGRLQWPTVIEDAGTYFVDVIKQKAPGVKVWVSLAAFQYPGLFQRPSVDSLTQDIDNAAVINKLDGITFFCWGRLTSGTISATGTCR